MDRVQERHTCNNVYQVENKVKFLTAEALRGVNSTIFDAQSSRLANVLGKRDSSQVQLSNKVAIWTRQLLCDDRRRWSRQCSKLRDSAVAVRRRNHRHPYLGAEDARGMQRPDGETQVKIDYTQLAVRQPDSGADRARPAGRRSRGNQQDVARHYGPEETASSKTDLNKQIDEKLRANGLRSLNAVTGRQLSCKSCETRCPMERPSSKRSATGTRNTNRIPAASPGRVGQTRGDLG